MAVAAAVAAVEAAAHANPPSRTHRRLPVSRRGRLVWAQRALPRATPRCWLQHGHRLVSLHGVRSRLQRLQRPRTRLGNQGMTAETATVTVTLAVTAVAGPQHGTCFPPALEVQSQV